MNKARRLEEIKPSLTLEISAKAREMKARGLDVIGFGAGEPDFDTPINIVEAGVEALQGGFTRYAPVAGIPDLLSVIQGKLKDENGLDYETSQILVSCGAKHSIFNIFLALLNPGEEVLIPTPAWLSYPEMVRLAGGRPVFVPASEEDGFLTDPEKLSEYLTPDTKALIVNSPSNPTGAAYDTEQLKALGEFALENGLFVVSDEIYENLVYDGFTHTSIASLSPELKEATLLVNGFSKAYAMTGWRLGYTTGPADLIKAMKTVQSHSTSGATTFAQKGAVVAFETPPEELEGMRREFERRRDYIVARLNDMEGVTCLKPQGAFYAFPNVSAYYGRKGPGGVISSSLEMASYLLEEAGVALVPGAAFQADEHVRISFACSMDDLERGADRIQEALGRLS